MSMSHVICLYAYTLESRFEHKILSFIRQTCFSCCIILVLWLRCLLQNKTYAILLQTLEYKVNFPYIIPYVCVYLVHFKSKREFINIAMQFFYRTIPFKKNSCKNWINQSKYVCHYLYGFCFQIMFLFVYSLIYIHF